MSDSKSKPVVIGITGGIACGKSEVGRILEEQGFAVCDADRVAHDLMEKGTPVFNQVVDHFGEQILGEEGQILRPILGKMVFTNPSKRRVLDALVHPAVRNELEQWINYRMQENKASAVLLPLLFESGMEDLGWSAVICVSAPEEIVYQRLEMRGLNPEEAEQRVCSQMPLVEKVQRADFVIPNNGTLEQLESVVRETVTTIMLER